MAARTTLPHLRLLSALSGHEVPPRFLAFGMATFSIADQERLIDANFLTAVVTRDGPPPNDVGCWDPHRFLCVQGRRKKGRR